MSELRKSIYPPIEVVLDGEAFQSRKFTRPMLLEKEPHEKEIERDPKAGEPVDEAKQWDAYCGWMLIVFGVSREKMEEVDFSEIEDAFMVVKTELLKRQGNRMEKHVTEVQSVTKKITDATDSVSKQVDKVEETSKNVKRSGDKI